MNASRCAWRLVATERPVGTNLLTPSSLKLSDAAANHVQETRWGYFTEPRISQLTCQRLRIKTYVYL